MKSYKKLSVGALAVLGLFSVPTIVAHADEGVVTSDFFLKDHEGKVIKEFKSNEVIQLKSENQENYQIDMNGMEYSVEKKNVLKTVRHEEESLFSTKENITLKTSPDLFGETLLELNEGEIVHRIKEVNEQNGFVKVKTAQSIEGWVMKSFLKQNLKNIPVTTEAFINNDSETEKSLYYGDSITITGFENNQYKVVVGEENVLVNKEVITFVQPPKRFINPIHIANTDSLITSLPGWRTDPVYGDRRHHGGVDVAIPKNTPIYATADGTVVMTHTGETVNNGAGYGNYVKLSHANNMTSIYAHLTSLVVKIGENVKQGQLIGYSGSTGKSTGNHLHFQMEQNGVLLDTSLIIREDTNALKPAPK